jgi:Bacterial archaeo-eukaryotic release factor family 11
MLHVDIPTLPELRRLAAARGDICASLFLPTTPLTQDAAADRIALKNLVQRVTGELTAKRFDKRRIAALEEHLADLVDDDEFWRFQAHSLAVLATPDSLRSYRLPNRLSEDVEIADRFHLKPLLRAVTFPHEAFVLALSQNAVRVVEICSDLPPAPVKVADLPKDAASAVRRSSVRGRSPSGRIQGSEGQKVLLRQYARRVDDALRPFLAGRETPLLLAAVEPLDAIFRSVSSYPHLVATSLPGVTEHSSEGELAQASRQLLDELYARELADLRATFDRRAGQGRATTDIADAARAATMGAIDTLLVDMDEVVPGIVDEADGRVTFHATGGADSYDVIDELACRALLTGARVVSARRPDIPHQAALAAILRYPV